MSWPSAEDVQYWSGIFTVAGVLIAIGALFFAGKQLSLSQRAGSVTARAALHDSLRERWTDYLSAKEEVKKSLAFGDLCNSIEISCAALTDKMFFGESKCVLEAYLLNTLKLIERNEVAREEFLGLLQEPKTFINIRLFLERHRKAFKALNQQQPAWPRAGRERRNDGNGTAFSCNATLLFRSRWRAPVPR